MYFDSKDKQSLTAKVYQHIRDAILDGRYQSGEYLIEIKLAEELGVSRTPIREAIKQLELEDLVTAIPNRGVMVQGITSQDADDIYAVRYLLEGQAAYWAAERIDDELYNKLTEAIELMELYTRKNDAVNLARLDAEFHEIIFTASHSRILKHILSSLHQNAKRQRQSSLAIPRRPYKSMEEHKAIYSAIEKRDPQTAKAAMETHILNAKQHRTDN